MCKAISYATIICLAAAASAQADDVKVFLLGGQSNMQGVGLNTDLPPALQGPQNDVLMYFGSSLTVLQPGFGAGSSYFGPEITFGRTIADAFPAENFALIKYAASGTDLANAWDPNTGGTYNTFRNVVTNGLTALANAGHTTDIVGMLWTQGERDVVIGTSGQYQANLVEFIADVRTRYGTDLPFFLSQLSSGQTDLVRRASLAELNAVRQAQANVAAIDPNSYLIVTDTFGLNSDDLHFNAAGQMALGQAFGQSYIDTVPEPATLGLMGLGGLLLLRRRRA